MKRTLTREEKQAIRDKLSAAEQAAHPDARITVLLADETDDDGKPVFRVLRVVEKAMLGRRP
jgi:hypothetical protein